MRVTMRRLVRAVPVLAAVAVAVVGCADRGGEPARSGGDTAAPKPATVELTEVRYAALADAVRQQKDKVVVVDVWATW